MLPSPNIWQHPDDYELESSSFDPDGLVETAIRRLADWADRDVVDLGCGTGFHLPRFAAAARRVTGIEPHPRLAGIAERRTRALPNVRVLRGTAQRVPLPDSSADVLHVRWAYFFGPGCEPGLAELDRVLRRGGTAFVVDNDASRSTFGHWFRRGFPHLPTAAEIERFWSVRGWTREPVLTCWRFADRAELARVVRIELPPDTADQMLAMHPGTEVEYAVNLWWRRY